MVEGILLYCILRAFKFARTKKLFPSVRIRTVLLIEGIIVLYYSILLYITVLYVSSIFCLLNFII